MARVRALAGLKIAQYTSPNAGGTMSAHRGVVLHIAEGTYKGTISWQMNPDQRYADGTRVTTSSTWIVGKSPGEWAQMVDTSRIAWTQRDGSRTWLSIELAGWAPEKPTQWQVEACAQLLAWAHREHGVPLAVADHPGERGLGHHSMDREWLGEEWGHEACPGSGVIGAKPAIVARAKQIVEGDDVSAEDVWRHRWRKLHRPDDDPISAEGAVRLIHQHVAESVGRELEILARQDAILARLDGADDGATRKIVREELDRHRALVDERLDEIAELVRLVESGERDAAAVVDEIGRRLHGGTDG